MADELKKFTVYVLRTSKGTLYTGQTNNLERRLKEHNSKTKRSAKYTRACGTCTLVYNEVWPTRADSCRREAEIKRMTKVEKEKLILTNQKNN